MVFSPTVLTRVFSIRRVSLKAECLFVIKKQINNVFCPLSKYGDRTGIVALSDWE